MSNIIKVLPPEPRKALLALSIFRFLTVGQFVRLGVAASETVMRDYVLRRIEKRTKPMAKGQKIGRTLPYVHYLTKHGAQELAEYYKLPLEEFPYPVGQVQFGERLAEHRFAQIDFHIGLELWAHSRSDTTIHLADQDFDVDGSRRQGTFRKKTQIDLPGDQSPVIADGIFGLTVGKTPLLYVVEVHRTTQTKFVGIQIKRYMDVLETGAVGLKYNVQTSPLICSVHTKANVLAGAKRFLMETRDFGQFKPAFLFNTTEQLKEDFSKGWHFADDTPADPFPRSETSITTPFID